MTEESAEERRARKARERAENSQKILAEIPQWEKALPETMGFNDLAMEHTRLRTRITEIQQMVITGKLDVATAQEFERRLVAQIHKVEERAHAYQTGRHVPKPGDY